MPALHDLYCKACGYTEKNTTITDGEFPPCPSCDETLRADWSHGQPPSTDVYGGTKKSWGCFTWKFDPKLGRMRPVPREYTSQRDLDRQMKEAGFAPAGDAEGGARVNRDSEEAYKGKIFNYTGKKHRDTPREATGGYTK